MGAIVTLGGILVGSQAGKFSQAEKQATWQKGFLVDWLSVWLTDKSTPIKHIFLLTFTTKQKSTLYTLSPVI